MNSVKLQFIKMITHKYQHTKISSVSVYWQWIFWKRNKENDPIYSKIKNNKVLRDKFKHGGEKISTLKTTRHRWKKLNTSKWKDLLCTWIRRINIVKISTLPKAICRFTVISVKTPMSFFTERERNPKISMEPQETLNSQNHPKKEQSGGITL